MDADSATACMGNALPSSGLARALLYLGGLLALCAVLFAVYMSVEDKW